MTAAKGNHSGRRRLLLLAVAVIATAAAASFGLSKAYAAVQFTTTSLSITDASTGQPITGDIRSDQLVTLTVTVSGGSYLPAGSVTLGKTTDGVNFTSLCDSNGNCSWPVTQSGPLTAQATVTMYLPVGSYDLQASFKGSNGSIASSSSLAVVNVVLANAVHNTTTALTANPSSINVGNSTTLTATVSSNDGIGIPQGTVYFYTVDGTVKSFVDSAQLDANGQASISRSDWTAQTYTVEADYLGQVFVTSGGATVQYKGSSGTATLTVGNPTPQKVQTTTTLTATPGVIRSDQTVVFLAHVVENGTCANCGPVGGTVSFTATSGAGSVVLGQAQVDANGYAELDVGGWVPGTYTITANYFGSVYYAASSGEVTIFTVNPATPTATTYLHDTQAYVGSTATLSAQVHDLHGNPVPAGELVTLTASDPALTSCIGTTDGTGTAACTVQFPAAGTYSVTASYPGDSTYDPSTGLGQIVVARVPTTVTYTGASSAPTGAQATLSGHLVDNVSGLPVANAPVTLTLNGAETCNATTDASGNASCAVVASEPAGNYQVSVSFAGTARYLPSSTTAPFTVSAPLPTHLAYSGDTTALAGQPATIAFTLTDDHGGTMAGRQVTLTLDGHSYSVTTDANGVASRQVTAPATAGPYVPTASYGGEPGYLTSTGTGALQVDTIPTSLTYVGDTSVYGGQPATIAFELTDQSGNPLAGMPVTLTLPDGSTYPTTTDANGIASRTVAAPIPSQPTTYSVGASFGGLLPYLSSTGSGSLRVTSVPTSIAYVGDTQVVYGNTATLAAKLLTVAGQPLASEPVSLTLASGQSCSATTDAGGVASCLTTAPVTAPAGPETVTVSFPGDPPYLASSNTGTIAVIVPTTTTVAALDPVLQGASVQLSATLTDASGAPLAGRTLTLTLGLQACTAPTDGSGVASCTIPSVTAPLGPVQTGASYAGEQYYLSSSGSGSTLVYAMAPGGGSFVVGDLTDTGSVYFWGSQWWKVNALSAGRSPAGNKKGQDPASFKGFAAVRPSPLVCGGTWSTAPGNSTPPPAGPLPSYMGIIVSSQNWKVGSVDSGNIVGLEIVRTDSGYQGNPGHAGTGTVVYGPFCP